MGDDNADNVSNIIILVYYIGLPLLLLGVSWLTQHLIIRSRRRFLSAQEAYYRDRIMMTNLKQHPGGKCIAPTLVTGVVVIANNYFISFASIFKHLFGGELNGYSGMCSDARRLALVRMLQDAESVGANTVCNVRFETSTINSGEKKRKSGGVELIAYGTAFRRTLP